MSRVLAVRTTDGRIHSIDDVEFVCDAPKVGAVEDDVLSLDDRALLRVCVDRYVADLRVACAEDQGTADGQPGTIGRSMQERLEALKGKLA